MNGYNLYGLKVNSELDIARYPKKKLYRHPDVCISFGSLKRPVPDIDNTVYKPFTVFNKDIYYQNIPSITQFQINGQTEVIIDPFKKDQKHNAISLFFIESILPILLVKNKIFAINASAIATDDGVYLFTTGRGDGKSSLAANLAIKGYQFISDDICVINWNEEKQCFMTKCHHPYVYIWKDLFPLFRQTTNKYEATQLRKGLLKYAFDMMQHVRPKYKKVQGICVVKVENEDVSVEMETLKGIEKLDFSKRIIHSHQIANITAKHKELFWFSSSIAKHLNLFRIKRSRLTTPKIFTQFIINEVFTKTTGR